MHSAAPKSVERSTTIRRAQRSSLRRAAPLSAERGTAVRRSAKWQHRERCHADLQPILRKPRTLLSFDAAVYRNAATSASLHQWQQPSLEQHGDAEDLECISMAFWMAMDSQNKNVQPLSVICTCGDPGGTQTHDFRNRNPTFYSTGLRGQCYVGCFLRLSAKRLDNLLPYQRDMPLTRERRVAWHEQPQQIFKTDNSAYYCG